MQKEAKISVIIPIYKVEDYLETCIESVLRQTYSNLEIILVDDGSPDHCGEICEKYAQKDKRIQIIHKENGGLSSARNAGLDVATGEYIAFIDSDDCVAETFIETLYQLCLKEDAEIAECDFVKFSNQIKEVHREKQVEVISSFEMQARIYSDDYVRTIVVWNKLYHQNIYANLRFPEGKIHEDEFTSYKAFDTVKKKIAITNEVLYYYRSSENSIMGKKFYMKRLDALQALEERKEYYFQKQQIDLWEKTVIKYQAAFKKYYFLVKENIENPEKYLEEIKKKQKENFLDYKKIKKLSVREKGKTIFFLLFPNIYYRLAKWKDAIKK